MAHSLAMDRDKDGEDMIGAILRALSGKSLAPPEALSRTEEVFTAIYTSNHWGDAESVSGAGSTLNYTENLRRHLPGLFAKYNVRKLFDAPSGDFNWMSAVLLEAPVKYIGGEIVRDLVKQNNARYAGYGVRFVQFDITRDRFPKADLWMCRDCLFHLPIAEINKALEHFAASKIPYLLTTTHVNTGFSNSDIPLGGFRMIDLFSPPFNFPQSTLERIEDWIPGFPPRLLCLWSREQVCQALGEGRRSHPVKPPV